MRKPPSERPRKKNKTSREVGKHQETSVTSRRNRRAGLRSRQTRADKAQPSALTPRRQHKEKSYTRPRRREEGLLEKPHKEGSQGRTGARRPRTRQQTKAQGCSKTHEDLPEDLPEENRVQGQTRRTRTRVQRLGAAPREFAVPAEHRHARTSSKCLAGVSS